MQPLQSARRLALQIARSGHGAAGEALSGFAQQCRLGVSASSSCTSIDGQTQLQLRGFSADSAGCQAAAGRNSTTAEGSFYYGEFIPKDTPPRRRNNLKYQIRERLKRDIIAQEKLQAAAPETAAAAPPEELPQNPKAADHQQQYIARLQASQTAKQAQKARDEAPKQKGSVAAAAKHTGGSATAEKKAKAETADAQATPVAATPAATSAAAPAAAAAAAAAADTLSAEAISSSASPPATPDAAAADSPPRSSSDWRLQQRLASQPATDTAAAAGIDFLQASQKAQAQAQAETQQNRRPKQQPQRSGKHPPQTPHGAEASPQAEPQPQPEPELSEDKKKQQAQDIETAVRNTLYTDRAAKDLTYEDSDLYYPLNAALLPEAFPDFYKGTLTEKGGCKGLQDEASYTGTNLIMYRDCIQSLHRKAQQQQHKQVHLTGPRGCGKSLALASLADWARSQGWLVLYVPSAQRLIEGGTFQKGEDGLWETPEVAKELLKSMVTNHKDQLADIPITSGSTLLQLVEGGLSASKSGDITAAAANLITEMANLEQTPTLIAVDDYNILYSHTNYHEWMNEVYRRQLQPHELRLASTLRLFEHQQVKNGMFVCASTLGGPVSPKLRVPGAHHQHQIPKLTIEEAALQLCHYGAQADGIPRELRLWQGRLASVPSPTMLAMQLENSQYSIEPEADLLEQQSQQALA